MSGFEGYREQLRALLEAGFSRPPSERALEFLRLVAETDGLYDAALSLPKDPARGYARAQLLTEGDGELAIVVLRPGDKIRAHDHGKYESSDAIVGTLLVVKGSETNTLFRHDGEKIVPIGTTVVNAGEALAIDALMIHSVENRGNDVAVSLHVYLRGQTDPRTMKTMY